MTAKRYDVIDKEEPRGQSVTYERIPCTARHCCTNLNRLTEENEQLKQQLNYIQNSISEHIKHQKTELGRKALKEIIEDYNEWLLGHKELKE